MNQEDPLSKGFLDAKLDSSFAEQRSHLDKCFDDQLAFLDACFDRSLAHMEALFDRRLAHIEAHFAKSNALVDAHFDAFEAKLRHNRRVFVALQSITIVAVVYPYIERLTAL